MTIEQIKTKLTELQQEIESHLYDEIPSESNCMRIINEYEMYANKLQRMEQELRCQI